MDGGNKEAERFMLYIEIPKNGPYAVFDAGVDFPFKLQPSSPAGFTLEHVK